MGCEDSAMPDEAELLTYLTGPADPSPGIRPPRVGDTVHLRPLPGSWDIEAWSDSGKRLGRLPPAERNALNDLTGANPIALRSRITALVPRPLLAGSSRIHIRVIAGQA
jgi:hypothetical protein